MTIEVDVIGPPGTGKTERITQLFLQEALKRGPERVAAVTFTRSAADELRTRTAAALGITTTNPKLLRARLPYVGTIHSLCYALLGRPQLVDSGGHFAQFCAKHGLAAAGPLDAPRDMEEASPYIALEAAGKSDVAQMRTFVAAAAHRCVPISAVLRDTPGLDAGRISRLAQEYEAWKTKEALLDYEDLLYQAAARRLRGVQVLICDEVQDNSALMWRCLDGWASGTELAVFGGDPFQSLYTFVGASPDLFLGRTGKRYVLGRSHRLGTGAVAYANDLLAHAGHQPVEWVGGGTDRRDANRLLLGRTNYVLAAARRDLEDRGIPYRELRGRGPLATYAADAYRTCVSIGGDRMVPWEAVAATVSSLPTHVRKGLDQRRIEALGRSGEDCDATAFRSLVGDPTTLKRLLPHADYFQRIERRDQSELFTEPKLALGTVHSAKGREADHVTLLTSWGTLPAQALNEPEGRKSEACVAFVAATRHRHSLELVDVIEGTRYPFPPISKGG